MGIEERKIKFDPDRTPDRDPDRAIRSTPGQRNPRRGEPAMDTYGDDSGAKTTYTFDAESLRLLGEVEDFAFEADGR